MRNQSREDKIREIKLALDLAPLMRAKTPKRMLPEFDASIAALKRKLEEVIKTEEELREPQEGAFMTSQLVRLLRKYGFEYGVATRLAPRRCGRRSGLPFTSGLVASR